MFNSTFLKFTLVEKLLFKGLDEVQIYLIPVRESAFTDDGYEVTEVRTFTRGIIELGLNFIMVCSGMTFTDW